MTKWQLFALLAVVPALLLGLGLYGTLAIGRFETPATTDREQLKATLEKLEGGACAEAAPIVRSCHAYNDANVAFIGSLLKVMRRYNNLFLSLAMLSGALNFWAWRSLTSGSSGPASLRSAGR